MIDEKENAAPPDLSSLRQRLAKLQGGKGDAASASTPQALSSISSNVQSSFGPNSPIGTKTPIGIARSMSFGSEAKQAPSSVNASTIHERRAERSVVGSPGSSHEFSRACSCSPEAERRRLYERVEHFLTNPSEKDADPHLLYELIQRDYQHYEKQHPSIPLFLSTTTPSPLSSSDEAIRSAFLRLCKTATRCCSSRKSKKSAAVGYLWLIFAELQSTISVDDGQDFFKCIRNEKIGTDFAAVHLSCAHLELLSGNREQARRRLLDAIVQRAEPQQKIREAQEAVKTDAPSLKDLVLKAKEDLEQEVAKQHEQQIALNSSSAPTVTMMNASAIMNNSANDLSSSSSSSSLSSSSSSISSCDSITGMNISSSSFSVFASSSSSAVTPRAPSSASSSSAPAPSVTRPSSAKPAAPAAPIQQQQLKPIAAPPPKKLIIGSEDETVHISQPNRRSLEDKQQPAVSVPSASAKQQQQQQQDDDDDDDDDDVVIQFKSHAGNQRNQMAQQQPQQQQYKPQQPQKTFKPSFGEDETVRIPQKAAAAIVPAAAAPSRPVPAGNKIIIDDEEDTVRIAPAAPAAPSMNRSMKSKAMDSALDETVKMPRGAVTIRPSKPVAAAAAAVPMDEDDDDDDEDDVIIKTLKDRNRSSSSSSSSAPGPHPSSSSSAPVIPPPIASSSAAASKHLVQPVSSSSQSQSQQQPKPATVVAKPQPSVAPAPAAKPASSSSSSSSLAPMAVPAKKSSSSSSSSSAPAAPVPAKADKQPSKPASASSSSSASSSQIVKPPADVSPLNGLTSPDALITVNTRTYLKLDCVGRGGSSKVYKVLGADRRIYALKRVYLQGADHSTMVGFANEITLLKSLAGKPNIVQLIDADVNQQHKVIHMVMEYGEIDLNRVLQRQQQGKKTLDPNRLRLLWEQMLQAVHTIHQHRIIHGDLKPANFLFVEGSLKLIDFGIAKAISNDATNVARDSQIGTLNYMSPEAIIDNSAKEESERKQDKKNKKASPVFTVRPASDIWSLGCILYQMVYGRTPFSHVSNILQKFQIICDPNHRIEFPLQVEEEGQTVDLNPAIVEVLEGCLRRDQHARMTIPQLLDHRFVRPDRLAISVQLLERILGQAGDAHAAASQLQASSAEARSAAAASLFDQLSRGEDICLASVLPSAPLSPISVLSSAPSSAPSSAESISSSSSSSSRTSNKRTLAAFLPVNFEDQLQKQKQKLKAREEPAEDQAMDSSSSSSADSSSSGSSLGSLLRKGLAKVHRATAQDDDTIDWRK